MSKKTVSIVAADFNREIVDEMISTAEAELESRGITLKSLIRVPGAYEVPLVVARELATVDAIVALGYIEKGETLHGEVMGHVVHHALVDLELKTSKPIGLGFIGPGATIEQARVRRVPCAANAVAAVARLFEILDS